MKWQKLTLVKPISISTTKMSSLKPRFTTPQIPEGSARCEVEGELRLDQHSSSKFSDCLVTLVLWSDE